MIRALVAAVGGWGGRGVLGRALTLMLHGRLGDIRGRMERLAARFAAGRLRRFVPRPRAGCGVARSGAGGAGWVWPRRYGWLVRLVGYPAAGYGSQLRAVLEAPEMVALLQAAPQAVRILRPLCRMLAVETPVLRPRRVGGDVAAAATPAAVDGTGCERVRRPRGAGDFGRVALPRGVAAAVRRRVVRTAG